MKILLVSHYFPPYEGVGAKRMGYLAHYLCAKNENVFIIKAENKESALSEKERKDNYSGLFEVSLNSIFSKIPLFRSYFWRTKYKEAINSVLKNNKIDLIIFSGGPFFYFDLGAHFFKKFGIEYILDYRDPYIDNEIGHNSIFGKFRSFVLSVIKNIIEKINLKNAKYIINVTEELDSIMKRKYNFNHDKFKIVMNGYDDVALRNAQLGTQDPGFDIGVDSLILAISGKFGYYSRDHVKCLFTSIKNVMSQKKCKIHIIQIGEKDKDMAEIAREGCLESSYTHLGEMDYVKAMVVLNHADVLITNNRSKNALGTKVFDYVFLNKPIIAFISRQSAIARFLGKFDNAYICENTKETERAINYIIENDIAILHKDINVEDYSRRKQMDLFYKIIRGSSC